jgi:hypothetical protein
MWSRQLGAFIVLALLSLPSPFTLFVVSCGSSRLSFPSLSIKSFFLSPQNSTFIYGNRPATDSLLIHYLRAAGIVRSFRFGSRCSPNCSALWSSGVCRLISWSKILITLESHRAIDSARRLSILPDDFHSLLSAGSSNLNTPTQQRNSTTTSRPIFTRKRHGHETRCIFGQF